MKFSEEWVIKDLRDNEENIQHRPPNAEYSFYEAVRSGDMEAVEENLKKKDFINPKGMGILSKNSVRNIRYHFVVATSMITRFCISGGLEPELAYRLSDFYIMKMDACNDIEEINKVHASMARDFTGKMIVQKKQSVLSKPVSICVDYIYSHINERLTVEVLAEVTGLSPSYLSRLFKQTLGVSISDYIREKKIEKAQHLLRFSEYSLVEISNYLAFSSQSHFIQVFENFVGISPKKYRDSFFKEIW